MYIGIYICLYKYVLCMLIYVEYMICIFVYTCKYIYIYVCICIFVCTYLEPLGNRTQLILTLLQGLLKFQG